MSKTVYARTSVFRKPEFRVDTAIKLDQNKLTVVKTAHSKKAEKHLKNIVNNYSELSSSKISFKVIEPMPMGGAITFDYIDGNRLDKVVFDAAIDNDLDTVHEIIDGILAEIDSLSVKKTTKDKKYQRIFGKTFVDEDTYLSIGYFDFNFDNFISKNGNTYLIDYEWLFDFPIPSSLIKTRLFYYLVLQLSSIYKTKASEETPVIGLGDHGFIHEETYNRYKDHLEHLSEVYIAEQHLQNFVKINQSDIKRDADFSTISRHTTPIYPSLINRVEHFERRNLEIDNELTNTRNQKAVLEKELMSTKELLDKTKIELTQIKNSRTWRLRSAVKRNLK